MSPAEGSDAFGAGALSASPLTFLRFMVRVLKSDMVRGLVRIATSGCYPKSGEENKEDANAPESWALLWNVDVSTVDWYSVLVPVCESKSRDALRM